MYVRILPDQGIYGHALSGMFSVETPHEIVQLISRGKASQHYLIPIPEEISIQTITKPNNYLSPAGL